MKKQSSSGKQLSWQFALVVALVIGASIYQSKQPAKHEFVPLVAAPQQEEARVEQASCDAVVAAWRAKQSDVMVECEGRVARILPDDNEGSRHQKFIVEILGGPSVLFAHNIDLAPRAPVRTGAMIGFRGEYEWTDKGGVIHWTHHDPKGRREGGWLRVDGHIYQ